MRFKKVISIAIAAVMCGSMAFNVNIAEASSKKANPNWPLTDKKVTFSIFTQIPGTTVEDVLTNEFTDWYEDQTNVHIDWRVVTTGASTQIPLMIASGDMPDAFFGNVSDAMLTTYALIDGIFAPLTEYINEENTPNIVKMLEESPSARQYSYLPDGNIYSLLRVVDTYNERMTKRAWVYEPWLEALDMDLPQTTDEFYDMLVAFRDEIPGLLGLNGVVPFAGATSGNPANNEPESFIMNSFVYYDRDNYIEVGEDNKLNFIANTEEYREGLRYLNKLYNENLLASDSWTQDRKGLLALTEGGEENLLGVAAAMYWGHFTTENGSLGRDMEFTAVPVLEGPNGVRNAYDRGQLTNNGRMVITTACDEKNIPIFLKWADWFFDAEAMMESGYSANYGREGVGWVYAEKGELDSSGNQAKFRYLRAADSKQNDNWFQITPYYESADFIGSIVDDAMNRKESYGGQQTTEKYMPYSAFDKRLPFLYSSGDTMEEFSDLKGALQNLTTGEIPVHRDRFITGELSLDKDWDAYLKTLEKVGVDRYVELYQKMYDDYLANQAAAGF